MESFTARCAQVMLEVDVSHGIVLFDPSPPCITITSHADFFLLFWQAVDTLNVFLPVRLDLFITSIHSYKD